MTGGPGYEEAKRLVETEPATTPAHVRNRALLAVVFGSGLDVDEALALTVEDVERPERRSELAPGLERELERWLERRKSLGLGRWAPLFCTLQGAPLKAPDARGLLKRARKAVAPVEPPEPERAASEPEAPAPEMEAEAPEPRAPPVWTPPPPRTEPPAPPLERARAPVRPVVPAPAPQRLPSLGSVSRRAMVPLLVVAVLVVGGIAAAAVLSVGGKKGASPHGQRTTGPGGFTGPVKTGPARVVFVPGQSFCRLVGKHQLGFWITLADEGGQDAKNVVLAPIRKIGGKELSSPTERIRNITVPSNAPKLQTVVSYLVPAGQTVQSCAVRVFSQDFAQSGQPIQLRMRPA